MPSTASNDEMLSFEPLAGINGTEAIAGLSQGTSYLKPQPTFSAGGFGEKSKEVRHEHSLNMLGEPSSGKAPTSIVTNKSD